MCPHRKVKIIFSLEMKHQSTVNFMLTVDCLLRWLLYGFLPAQDEINLNKKKIINMFSDEFIINTYKLIRFNNLSVSVRVLLYVVGRCRACKITLEVILFMYLIWSCAIAIVAGFLYIFNQISGCLP